MSRPTHSPLPFHLEGGGQGRDLAPPLPEGWVREWDSNYNIPFFVNTRTNPPHSQWTSPYEDSSKEREHAAGPRGDRGSISDALGGLADHSGGGSQQAMSGGEEFARQSPSPVSNSYNPSYGQQATSQSGGGLGHQQQQQAQRQSHHNWLELGGAAAIGALADHEWEKHKQTKAYSSGVEQGRMSELQKENALQAELQRVKHENEILQRQQQTQAYGGWSTGAAQQWSGPPPQPGWYQDQQGGGGWEQGHGPPPAEWGGRQEPLQDGRMGPYA